MVATEHLIFSGIDVAHDLDCLVHWYETTISILSREDGFCGVRLAENNGASSRLDAIASQNRTVLRGRAICKV